MRKLTLSDVGQELKKLPGWDYREGKLHKQFKFQNFPMAVMFVNKLVDPIEEFDHHPSITITYDRVTLTLFSNAAGALTDKDVKLAHAIDTLVK